MCPHPLPPGGDHRRAVRTEKNNARHASRPGKRFDWVYSAVTTSPRTVRRTAADVTNQSCRRRPFDSEFLVGRIFPVRRVCNPSCTDKIYRQRETVDVFRDTNGQMSRAAKLFFFLRVRGSKPCQVIQWGGCISVKLHAFNRKKKKIPPHSTFKTNITDRLYFVEIDFLSW